MKKQQATLKDLALQLNLSISTVSRALSDSPLINKKTKSKVRRAAKQVNYEPNLIAQSLRKSKANALGVIVPELNTHFFSATISGIQDVALQKGYNVIVCQSGESYEVEMKKIQTLIASRVDGLLISLSRETNQYSHLESYFAKGIPLVFFDRACKGIDTSKITVDDHDGAFQATEHLIQQGCRRIAHLSGPPSLDISKSRLQGYFDALEKYNIEPAQELIVHASLPETDAIEQTNYLLDLASPPDAIFAFSDLVAFQAMKVVKERGLKIPDEVALVGFTNTPESTLLTPSLTTVAQPAYQMGEIAASHMLEQIDSPEKYVPREVILKTELLIRSSSLKKP